MPVAGWPSEPRRLAELVPAQLRPGAVPVALDRYDLVLRSGTEDVRLPFGAPFGCPRELPGLLSRSGVPARRG